MPDSLLKYFPSLPKDKKEKLFALKPIYERWNRMINVISRKDMDNFFVHHVLHSLSVAKRISFIPGTTVIDVGTGGGFPGIPLAVMFPETEFTLLDSVEKKIKVVKAVTDELGLNNVTALRKRIEEENRLYDFVIGRAISELPKFAGLTSKNISLKSINNLENGILYLKGGDIENELSFFQDNYKIWNIGDFFSESFFETKKIVYLPVSIIVN